MDPKDYEFFAEHGYLELGKLLSDEEVQRYLELYERDRAGNQCCWHRTPGLTGLADTSSTPSHMSINLDVLVSSPEFDALIRHPEVLALVAALIDGPICFSRSSSATWCPTMASPPLDGIATDPTGPIIPCGWTSSSSPSTSPTSTRAPTV